MIACDEALHLTGTQHILNLWRSGSDDPEMAEISEKMADQGKQIFLDVVEQEKEWADYLFKDGSMIGMNKEIICQYIEYVANQRLGAIGFEPAYATLRNPLPWMNGWLVSDNVQVAPQESEITSYLVGAIDSEVSHEDFSDIEL